MPKISVIIPAYNEEKPVRNVIQKIRDVLKNEDYEILVVDDGSTDKTRESAIEAGARVISHPYNIGNGAAVKTGMRQAAGEIFLLIDADEQHDPYQIPNLLKMLEKYDMVVAARTGWGGAPIHRKLANAIYNTFASYLTEKSILDLTSGFRVIKARVAKKFIYLLPNTFSYPSTITMSLFKTGHSVGYFPVKAHPRTGVSKISILKDGARFLVIIMKIATLFSPLRIFLPMSIIFILIGLIHTGYKMFVLSEGYTGFSTLFITTGVMIFLMGLIAEQIALLRMERSESA